MGSDAGFEGCAGYGGLISIHAPRMGSDQHVLEDVVHHEFISIHAPRMGSDTAGWTTSGCSPYFNPRSPDGKRPAKMDSLSHNAGTIVHSRHRSYRKPLLTLQIPSRRLQTPHNIHYEVIKQQEEHTPSPKTIICGANDPVLHESSELTPTRQLDVDNGYAGF